MAAAMVVDRSNVCVYEILSHDGVSIGCKCGFSCLPIRRGDGIRQVVVLDGNAHDSVVVMFFLFVTFQVSSKQLWTFLRSCGRRWTQRNSMWTHSKPRPS